jgi:hypothetical protein
MTLSNCPSQEELSRRLTLGDAGDLDEHFESCRECGPEWRSLSELRGLARELPTLSEKPRNAFVVRERILREASAEARRSRAKVAAVWAVAAAAAVLLALGLRARTRIEPGALYRATLTPSAGAQFDRESASPDEVVRLAGGTLHVEVEKLHAGERFRVFAGDGVVEVRGTAFDVSTLDGHLDAVHVEHGRVEVRSGSGATVVLTAGENWNAVIPPADPPSTAPIDAPPAPSKPGAAAPPQTTAHPASAAPLHAALPDPAGPIAAPPKRDVATAVPDVAPTPTATATMTASTASASAAAPLQATVPPNPSSTSPDEGDPEAERRERREERRERNDQRHLR